MPWTARPGGTLITVVFHFPPFVFHLSSKGGSILAIFSRHIKGKLSPKPFGNRQKYFRGSFQFSILSQSKKYRHFGDLKFNNLGIFQSLKLRISMGKNPSDFS